jgi:hypothetical protein
MTTPLFEIIKRNLAVPDEDRGGRCAGDMRRRRKLQPKTIAGIQIAWRLHTGLGVNRWQACHQAAAEAGCSVISLYKNLDRYAHRLREDGLL